MVGVEALLAGARASGILCQALLVVSLVFAGARRSRWLVRGALPPCVVLAQALRRLA